VTLLVDEIDHVSDEQRMEDEVTVSVSYESASERLNFTITAPQDQMPDIALHVKEETGLELDVQPNHPLDQLQAKSGIVGSHGNKAGSMAAFNSQDVEKLIGVITALLTAQTARLTLQTAQITLKMEKEKRQNKESSTTGQPLPTTPPARQRALRVILDWEVWLPSSADAFSLEHMNFQERFTLPPDVIQDVITAIENKLGSSLSLKVRMSAISSS
jgi:hypothetical protein